MSLTVVTTAGAADANSYASRDDYRAYMLTRPESWPDTEAANEADDDEVDRALVTCTALIEEGFDWDGWAVSSTQALGFPRSGLSTRNGYQLPSDSIPALLRDATCEYVAQVVANEDNRTLDSAASVQGIKSLKAGPVDVEFRAGIAAKPIPDRVVQMLSRWGTVQQSGSTVPAVRV